MLKQVGFSEYRLDLSEEQNLWVTSDTHYHHKQLCHGTSSWTDKQDKTRNFETLEQMNDVIINNLNEKVKENDWLLHGGDVAFGGFDKVKEFYSRLNCKNLIQLLGNHDHHIGNNKDGIWSRFALVSKYIELSVRKKDFRFNFVYLHFPIASHNNLKRGWSMLHGHVHFPHEAKLQKGKMMDIGMDGNNMQPYSIDEIKTILKDRPCVSMFPHDHHSEVLEDATTSDLS